MRAAGVPLFSVEQHLPAEAFDVLAFNLSAELVYTNVLNLLDLAALPLHGAARGGGDALVVAGGHCAFNPEPLADFVDAFVLGDGEEVVGEVNEVVGAWLAAAPARRRATAPGCCTSLARLEGVYVPALYEPAYAGGRLVSTSPVSASGAGRGHQAHGERPGGLALSDPPAGAADRGRPRPPERRGLPRLHPRLPLLPGGHDHSARARAAGGSGARDGAARAGVERARRGHADLALDGRLLGDRGHRARHRRGPRARRTGLGEPPVAAGGRLHGRARRRRSRRCAGPGSRSRPKAAPGACARSSTS